MKNKQILAALAQGVEESTPDVLASVLRRCAELDGSPRQAGGSAEAGAVQADIGFIDDLPVRPARKARPAWTKWAAGLAAMLVLAFGVQLGYGYYAVDSVIGFDVNPSIELEVNRGEQVLSALPLNADAEIVLDGMRLKGVDLDVAVNALIGSMLKNGYVSEIKNSILISVKHEDSVKGAALQQRLSQEVSSLLDGYAVGGAVLSQTVSEDERLQTLASQHQISLGKAALVDLLVSRDARLQFADIATLSINDINLLVAGQPADQQRLASAGQASSGAYIGEAQAKTLALAEAGVGETDVSFTKIKLDFDDGCMVYEVEFLTADTEYEYEIDAVSGRIVDRDVDRRQQAPAQGGGSGAQETSGSGRSGAGSPGVGGQSGSDTQGAGDSPTAISETQAKDIALSHAGFAETAASRLRVDFDRDGGHGVYDVEFKQGSIEYEYKIDAVTGEILEWDSDYDD